MDLPSKKAPKRRDERTILQFDYDCFYAQVYENKNPALKSKPLGIKQKNILATCNYNARARGVRKLQLITEAKKTCPDLVIIEGEDLTPFRDTSKLLFNFLRSYLWNNKAERLGFDEVFLDVTDIIDYNMFCLNKHSLGDSFFHLSSKNPEHGFLCDLTSIAGCVEGTITSPTADVLDNPAYLRLLLGSHLAMYLRTKLEEDFGYTSTCGISHNKVLSKLAGSKNKPRNQTTLITLNEDDAMEFMDKHIMRAVPGIGFKMASTLEAHVNGVPVEDVDSHSFESRLTVGVVRACPKITPGSMESLLAGPGAERGVGSRIWALLHGIDPAEVKDASDIPSQLSIEDTYGGLATMPQITEELHKLSQSLVRRMRVDLRGPEDPSEPTGERRWIAHPKTLRLSIRSWHQMHGGSYNRHSRSGPLPVFIFDQQIDIERIAERLVVESLLPLLRRLQTERGPKWNIQLINICVANMIPAAATDKTGVGRDIANMFKNQDEALRPWKVLEDDEENRTGPEDSVAVLSEADTDDAWETTENHQCPTCGYSIPSFALHAHLRYHNMES